MEAANSLMQGILEEIDLLFEPSPTLHVILTAHEARLLAESDSRGRVTEEMIAYIGAVLASLAGRRELDEILNAHPRLGATHVASVHSRAEQASLQQQQSESESEQLRALNAMYEATFPGLRYVVFVHGRSRAIIMEDMRRRIARQDVHLEREEGIRAMVDIARDRLQHRRTDE